MPVVMYSTKGAARTVGLASCYVTRLCASGKIPCLRVNTRPGEQPQVRVRASRRNGTVTYKLPAVQYLIAPDVVSAMKSFKDHGGRFFTPGAFVAYLGEGGAKNGCSPQPDETLSVAKS